MAQIRGYFKAVLQCWISWTATHATTSDATHRQ